MEKHIHATALAAISPVDECLLDLGQASRIQKDISAKLDAARAVPPVLETQRQRHLIEAASGDETALAALAEIKRSADANASTIADLESALEIVNVRVGGCKARLKDAKASAVKSEQAALRAKQAAHWESVDELCAQIRREYQAAQTLANEEAALELKYRDLVCDPGRDPMLDQMAASHVASQPGNALQAAIDNLQRECR